MGGLYGVNTIVEEVNNDLDAVQWAFGNLSLEAS
ncbi:unnamed protein product [Urochloa humidicola]